MSFAQLPNEILLQISASLCPPAISCLMRVNHHMADLLSPLIIAAACQKCCCLKYGRQALYFFAGREDKASVCKLLENGMQEFSDEGLFHDAVATQHSVVVKTLMECGVHPESRDSSGRTFLGVAAARGRADTVRLLLARERLDTNPRDHNNETPLHRAARRGYANVVGLMVADGRVDVNSRNGDFCTPLHLAVNWGEEETVRVLLDSPRVNVNSVNCLGQTPLHLAEREGVLDILLADGRVDVNRAELHGHTPLHMAAGEGRVRVVELLLEREDIDLDKEGDGVGGSVKVLALTDLYEPEVVGVIFKKLFGPADELDWLEEEDIGNDTGSVRDHVDMHSDSEGLQGDGSVYNDTRPVRDCVDVSRDGGGMRGEKED